MLTYLRSTVGQKAVMAATGVILIGFLIVHLLANLLVFVSAAKLNEYSALLKANPALLWGARSVLIAAAIAHIVAAIQLTRRARAARPVGYAKGYDPQASTFASRTIRWGGLLIAIFVVFHLLHLTTGTVHASFAAHDVYGNVIRGFQVWPVALFYVLAMVAVGLHLYHGAWSYVRTLGLARPTDNPLRRRIATGLAFVIWLGFTSIPLAVLAGILK